MNALLPFALPAPARLTLTSASAQTPATVAAALSANEDLSTLASALETAGLTEALSGEGPFTVFAPTNEAFARLPAGELEQLLSYHVVADRRLEASFVEVVDDLDAAFTPRTLLGSTLKTDIEEDTDPTVVIDNVAYLDEAAITAGNGVVHIIDAVLVPGVRSDGVEDTRGGATE